MYRVMLVDDDTIARMKLKNLLQWEKLNCRIVGEASSGWEAVAQIEKCRPQIIITDIDMPGMNGVDLIQYTKSCHPEIYILALSAYDDFDYVRDSLKYGALDYMLKHQLTARKLETALQEAFPYTSESLEKESNVGAADYEDTFLETFIKDFSQWNTEALKEHIPLRYRKGKYVLAVGCFEEGRKLEEKRLRYLKEIIRETLSFYDGEVYWGRKENCMIFLFMAAEKNQKEDIEEAVLQIGHNAVRYTGLNLAFKTSSFYFNLTETQGIYDSLLEKNVKHELGKKRADDSLVLKLEEIRELEQNLQDRNIDEIKRCLTRLFSRLQNSAGNSGQISIIAIELCNILQRKLSEQNETSKSIFLLGRIEGTLKNIQNGTNIDNVYELVIALYSDYIQNISDEEKALYSNPLMNQCVLWIKEHWDQPISLRDVAGALNVNSAYLSRLFKRYTGKTIVDFINELKMERAKEMIEEGGQSLKEISYNLGFQNYNYFYRLFKKVYGISPSDLEIKKS